MFLIAICYCSLTTSPECKIVSFVPLNFFFPRKICTVRPVACNLDNCRSSSQGIVRLVLVALSTTVTTPFLKAAAATSIVMVTAAFATLPPTLREVSAIAPVAFREVSATVPVASMVF